MVWNILEHFSHHLGNGKIIPTDFHSIIFRGRQVYTSTPCQGGFSISGSMESMVWWGPKSWGHRCTESGNQRNSNPMGFSWVFPHGETWLHNAPSASKPVMGLGDLHGCHSFPSAFNPTHDRSMVLLYMVCHGSHQYTPFMLAYIPAPWILWARNQVPYGCCGTLVSNRSALRYGSTGTP